MSDELDDPVFHLVAPADYLEQRDIVVHRTPGGEVAFWHSPLTHGAIRCSICEGGARVYL